MIASAYTTADSKEAWRTMCAFPRCDKPHRSFNTPSEAERLCSPLAEVQVNVVLDALISGVSIKSFLSCAKLLVAEMCRCNESPVPAIFFKQDE